MRSFWEFGSKVMAAASIILLGSSCFAPQPINATSIASDLSTSTPIKAVEGDAPDHSKLMHTMQIFADSMRTNDIDQMKKVVAEESWKQIERWETEHTSVRCGFSLKRLLEQEDFTILLSPIPDEVDVWNVHVIQVFSCPTAQGSLYSLVIDQVVVRYAEEEWYVISWQGVNERFQ